MARSRSPNRASTVKWKLGPDQQAQLVNARAEMEGKKTRLPTKWIVVTGAPGSGKTTLINELFRHDFNVVHDPAREVIREFIENGVSKHAARSDYSSIQKAVLGRMLRASEGVPTSDTVFFDYALPDNLAFLAAAGMPWDASFVTASCKYAYQHAFLLAPLKRLPDDPVRIETRRQRQQIHAFLNHIYALLEVPVTHLPATILEDRIQMIFDKLPLR